MMELVSWAALQGDGEGVGGASAHKEAVGGVILVGRHGRWDLAWRVPSGICVILLRGDEAFRNWWWSLKEVHSDWGARASIHHGSCPIRKRIQVPVLVSVMGSANDNSEFTFFWLLSDALPLSASLSTLCRVLQSMTEEGPSLGKCILQRGLLPCTQCIVLYWFFVITFVELLWHNWYLPL